MAFSYRVIPLGGQWPGERTRTRRKSPFGSNWGGTLKILEKEIKALGGRDVTFGMQLAPTQLRIDGGIRADARISDPSVVISFNVGPNRLSFPCDTYNWWQDNVRAIALALEALRAVDRYGVRKGSQYEGFKALPGRTEASVTPTPVAAAEFLEELTGGEFYWAGVLDDLEVARLAVRRAKHLTHPDRPGGSTEAFQRVQAADAALASHHGVSSL